MATYRLLDSSILEVESLSRTGRRVTSKHVLDKVLGNDDGKFTRIYHDFSLTARDVTLQGSTLSALLRKKDGSWVAASVEFWVEEQEVSAVRTHRLFILSGGDAREKLPAYHEPSAFLTQKGWTLQLRGSSFLLRDSLSPAAESKDERSRNLITRTIDLDDRLGNSDGHFDPLGIDFSDSARHVYLTGTVLHAELENISGEWKEAEIDLSWMTEVWRLDEEMPSVQIPDSDPERWQRTHPTSLRLYAPLPHGEEHIRLCYIQPGTGDEDIHCHMLSRPMDPEGSYKCLSYAWGSIQDKRRTVYVNSHAVEVTENLFNALKSLRLLGVTVPLWIDALCIDQTNTSERGTQVGMMAKIFGRAQQVIIWLGQLDPVIGSSEVFSTINPKSLSILLSRFSLCMDRDLHVRDALHETIAPFPGLVSMGVSSLVVLFGVVEAYRRFISTAWFQRTWTLQEYIFARDAVFLFSDQIIGAEVVENAIQTWAHHRLNCCSWDEVELERMSKTDTMVKQEDFWGLYRKIMLEIWSFGNRYHYFKTLKEESRHACIPRALSPGSSLAIESAVRFLHEARQNQSSDPRDKIFAFANIAVNAFGSFKPDYTLSVNQVYTSFTLKLVQEMGNFDIWSLVGVPTVSPNTRLLDLPSWAIDWTQAGPIFSSVRFLQKRNTTRPSLTYRPPEDLFRHVSDDTITVYAGRLDEIFVISGDTTRCRNFDPRAMTAASTRVDMPPDPEIVLPWMRFVGISNVDEIPQQHERWNQLWRLLVGDTVPLESLCMETTEEFAQCCRETTSEDEQVVRELAVKAQRWPEGVPLSSFSDTEIRFSDLIRVNAVGRYLFSTLGGRYGLCPTQAQPGDVVFYVAGSRWPVLLRPYAIPAEQRKGHTSSYKLVGICHVQGVLDHEVQAILDQGDTIEIH